MKTKIILVAFLMTLMAVSGTSALADDGCCADESWDWVCVKYTELDFRAMDYLWSNWIIQEAGKVAVLPFSDSSDESLIADPLGGGWSGASRRVCEALGYHFSRLGLLPIPYDDCLGASMMVVESREESAEIGGTPYNNYLHLRNKTADMLGALKQYEPAAFPAMAKLQISNFLMRDEIIGIGEMLGADVIIRGSINTYGMQDKIESNLRTFIPPFLGFFNKDKEGMILVTAYMYDAHTGELIWAAHEIVENSPTFPLFSTDYEIMAGAENEIALRIVSHLMPPPPPPPPEEAPPPPSEPAETHLGSC